MALAALSSSSFSIGKFLRNFLAFVGSVILFSLLLVANVFQVASLLLRPFSRSVYRRFNRFVANSWWGICVLWARHILRIHVEILGDAQCIKESAIIIINHQSMADVPVLMDLALKHHSLGDMKCFVKRSLLKVPGMGWGMAILEFPFLKRNWEADKENIHQIFARILQDKIPIWMMSFVEGTRLRPHKLARSQEYAKKAGLFHPENVLIPRTKGFVVTVQQLREHVQAVYDITIVYQKGVPSLWQFASGEAPLIKVRIKRYPVAALPESEEDLSDWLMRVFEEKNRFLAQQYQQQLKQ